MKPAQLGFDAALREARLAEAAHLEALVRAQDAGALRLDHLRNRLLDALPPESALRRSMDLRLPPDFPPRLFLDYSRSVAIAPDGRGLALEEDNDEQRIVLATAANADDMVGEILRLEAHKAIQEARKGAPAGRRRSLSSFPLMTWGLLLFVWLSGVLVGAALLAALAIYMKNLSF